MSKVASRAKGYLEEAAKVRQCLGQIGCTNIVVVPFAILQKILRRKIVQN